MTAGTHTRNQANAISGLNAADATFALPLNGTVITTHEKASAGPAMLAPEMRTVLFVMAGSFAAVIDELLTMR